MKKGFTLIELLVVVLIIGILSAVALPQYEKAVEKARLAAVIPIARSVKNAVEEYYLANGTYSGVKMEHLSISLPADCTIPTSQPYMATCRDFYITIDGWSSPARFVEVFNTPSSATKKLGWMFILDHVSDSSSSVFNNNAGGQGCVYAKNNTKMEAVCKSMGMGTQRLQNGTDWQAYLIE